MYRAAYDDDLDCYVVLNERGEIVARNCPDLGTAEDIALAIELGAE